MSVTFISRLLEKMTALSVWYSGQECISDSNHEETSARCSVEKKGQGEVDPSKVS